MTKELVAVEKEVCDQLQLLNLDIGDAIILQKEEENSLPKLAPLSDNSTSTAGGADSDTYTSLSKVTTTATTTNTLSSSEENTNLPKVVGFNSLYATNNTDTILLSDNYNDDLMSSGISIDTTTKTTIEIENQNQQQQQQQHYLEVKEEKSCQVRFGDIELKEYGMIMGDHPDTVDGPSLTISWTPQLYKKYTIDNWEKSRGYHPRRKCEELKFRPAERSMYLKIVVGVSQNELNESIRIAGQTRRQRIETVKNLKNEKVDIFLQPCQRKSTRIAKGLLSPFC